MKFAIVDLGSNTIRLSVYNTLPEGGFDLLFSEKEMAGLVSYVHGGVLSPEGIQRACGAIRDFQALLRQFDLDAPHVFADPGPADGGAAAGAAQDLPPRPAAQLCLGGQQPGRAHVRYLPHPGAQLHDRHQQHLHPPF